MQPAYGRWNRKVSESCTIRRWRGLSFARVTSTAPGAGLPARSSRGCASPVGLSWSVTARTFGMSCTSTTSRKRSSMRPRKPNRERVSIRRRSRGHAIRVR